MDHIIHSGDLVQNVLLLIELASENTEYNRGIDRNQVSFPTLLFNRFLFLLLFGNVF